MFWSSTYTKIQSLFFKHRDLDYLRPFPVLRGFTDHELYLFSQIVHERKFQEGEIVYREQYPLAVIFLVVKGCLTLISDPKHPNSCSILNPLDFIGIVDMYNENRRKGQAIAGKDTILLAVSHVDFQAFVKTNPSTGIKLLNNICISLSHTIFQFLYSGEDKR